MSDNIKKDDFDFEKAFDESFKDLEENSLIKSTVVQVSGDTVFLDFGAKSEAKIPLSEFSSTPKIGDVVDVFLLRLEGRNGDPVVSKQRADHIKNKKELYNLYREKNVVEGIVTEVKKNGVSVKFKTVDGFIPLSLFDINKNDDLNSFLNKPVKFYVERIMFKDSSQKQKKGKSVTNEEFIGNRKKYLQDESNIQRNQFFEQREVGEVVKGVVKNITDFGAFIDLGGFEALLPIKEVSWVKVDNINNILKVGQTIEVKILDINKQNFKITVGLKQLEEDPWSKFIKQYKINDIVKGSVTSITKYGAFIKIIDGVEGLLHISDMSWTKNIKNPAELVQKGQLVEVMIINIDEEKKRVNLSLKHLLENPWDKVEKKYKVGTKVKGKIKNIAAFGLFIELEEGIDALLPVEDISWTETIRNPHSLYKIGDEIEAIVTQCDTKKNKIKVGIKQMSVDPWKKIKENYRTGDIIKCKFVSVDETKGMVVKIIDQITTYIPFSQIGTGRIDEIRQEIKNNYKENDEITALILNLDYSKRVIKLSIKEYLKREEKKKVEAFLSNEKKDDKFTLGDMVKSKNK